MTKRVIIGITGASGAPYAKKLFDVLRNLEYEVDIIISQTAKRIWSDETGCELSYFKENGANYYENSDIHSACIASGSVKCKGMVVIPSSMGTLARIARGISDTLLTRAADVTLKEKRKLIVVPRETPYNAIHLENMLQIDRAGGTILPASPPFYHKPEKIDDLIDFIAARVLDHLNIEQNLIPEWTVGDD